MQAPAKWQSCERCPLHKTRTNVVWGRGAEGFDFWFVGLGPGKAEDVLGEPFVGPAGKLLELALPPLSRDRPKLFFSNLVLCRPCNRHGQSNRDPLSSEVDACKEHFPEQLRNSARPFPKGIILLGKTTQREWRRLLETDSTHRELFERVLTIQIPHPAALARRGGTKAEGWEDYKHYIRSFLERPWRTYDLYPTIRFGG